MSEPQVDPRCVCGAPYSNPLHVIDHQFVMATDTDQAEGGDHMDPHEQDDQELGARVADAWDRPSTETTSTSAEAA